MPAKALFKNTDWWNP